MRIREASSGIAAIATAALVALTVSVPAHAAPAPTPGALPQTTGTEPADAPTVDLCGTGVEGAMRCLAEVRTDLLTPHVDDEAPAGYGPADLAAAYDLPTTAGVGQTVAVVNAFDNPNAEADLAVYREQFGLPPCTTDNGCFRKVDQRGGTNYPSPPPPNQIGWLGEIALDLAMVSATCPQCDILLVEADDAFPDNLGAGVDTAVELGAGYVSNSYGTRGGEHAGDFGSDHYYNHPGVVVTAATGDNGYGMTYPAASTYVTAVGGTSLVPADNDRGWAETVWDGTGSGCSAFAEKPDFQTDPGCPNRVIADVSAVADPATGVAVYNSNDGPVPPGWAVYGGTSASAPIIAATYALAGTPGASDYPNSYPYATPTGLNDITLGSNGDCGTYLCTGGQGYDGPTGLGTPWGVTAFAPPGPRGAITGTVTDAADGDPVEGATVTAGRATVSTDADGHYEMSLPVGSYTMSATAFGYEESGTTDVPVTANQTTTRDFALSGQDLVNVTGTVLDGSGQGWPMYARVGVDGTTLDPVFTDPYTGRFSLDLPANTDYTLHVIPEYPGYQSVDRPVAAGTEDIGFTVSVPVDAVSCSAPGYDFEVTGATSTFDDRRLPDGWTVRDNTGNGSWVFDDPGHEGNQTGGDGGFAIMDGSFLPNFLEFDSDLITAHADLSTVAEPVLDYDTDYVASGNADGTVDLSVDGGQTWENVWTARGGSRHLHEHFDLPQAAGKSDVLVRFHYTTINFGWWQVDNVILGRQHCDAQPGGLLAGYVTDNNTGAPLNGATVTSADRSAETGTTAATPSDPNLDDGYYWMFTSLTGDRSFTATRPSYQDAPSTVDVASHWITRADFGLDAGHLTLNPTSVSVEEGMGATTTRDVTLTNDGTSPVSVTLREQGGDSSVLAEGPGAPTQRVDGTFTPSRFDPDTAPAEPAGEPVPAAAPWTPIANYPTPIMDNGVATGDDGTVYSVAGIDGSRSYSTGYAYDPGTGTWSSIGSLAQTRENPGAAFVDGKLYVIGGWAINGLPVPGLEIYDPSTNSWSTGADLPEPSAAPAVATVNGTIYVVGGCGSDVCGTNTVYSYDPGTDSWTREPDYPEAVGFAACGGMAGKLYCVGGAREDSTGAVGTSRNGYVYTPGSGGWAPIADYPVDVWGAGYTAANGRLVVSGGAIMSGTQITNEGYAYDPAADSWTAIPNSNNAVFRGGSACGMYKIGGSRAGFSPIAGGELLPGYSSCGASDDLDWLSIDEDEFTVDPGQSVTVTLTVDANAASVTQPGVFTGRIGVENDSPYSMAIDITMTAEPPSTWGKITGTVTGERCDGSTEPLVGAVVAIDSWAQSFTLRTDADGRYELWLDARNSPITLVVAQPGWRPTFGMAGLTAGTTRTMNFSLVTLFGC